MHYLIQDTDFEKILKFLEEIKGIHKKNVEKIRIFLEAVYYLCKTGCQIRLLPNYYGHWRAVHKRFKEWGNRGIWEKMFEYFKQDPDMEWIMLDSSIVRAHACASGYGKNSQEQEALGRSKGGFTTKIHIATDALGNPLKLHSQLDNDMTLLKQKNYANLYLVPLLLLIKLMMWIILLLLLLISNVLLTFLLKKIVKTLALTTKIFINTAMLSSVLLAKLNILGVFFLALINLLVHIFPFCILLESSFGSDKISFTEPRSPYLYLVVILLCSSSNSLRNACFS